MKPKYTSDQILKWKELGESLNEETGINKIYGKKTSKGWIYAELYFRYGTVNIGWILKDGVMYD